MDKYMWAVKSKNEFLSAKNWPFGLHQIFPCALYKTRKDAREALRFLKFSVTTVSVRRCRVVKVRVSVDDY